MAASASASATLADRLPELLENVHPGWLPFFEENGLHDSARAALARAEPDAAALAPAPELVFEFLRYFGPDDALVLIMGQDPYPHDAQGVCFSIPPETPVKNSLKAVFDNLEARGLARRHLRVKGDEAGGLVRCGDLRSWAAQGVVLMNAALTTRVGGRGNHRGHWKEFTTRFVRALSARSAARGHRLICMLWGNDARAFAPGPDDALVYEWTHPSPLSDNRQPAGAKFRDAPHFADANEALRAAGRRAVEWDPLGYTYAFTDGSCPRNGAPDAEASYAATIITGPLKGVEVSGLVEPLEFALVDAADPAAGFAPVAGGPPPTPTNNRGEYLAWCWVLLLLVRGKVRGRVEVVSDCNLFIQSMEVWLPARRVKGKAEGMKNFDLLVIGEALLKLLREEVVAGPAGVTLSHVNSHQKRPPPAASTRDKVFWHGNDRADKLAGEVTAAARADAAESAAPDYAPSLTAPPFLAWSLLGRHA